MFLIMTAAFSALCAAGVMTLFLGATTPTRVKGMVIGGVVAGVVGLYTYFGTPNTQAALGARAMDYQGLIDANPENVDNYMGKARTLMQMRAFQQAQTTYELALDVSSDAPVVYQEYISAMRFAGLEPSPRTAQQAIMGLPQDDQRLAIQGMVAGLAARLNQEGGTKAEWEMLARSYDVLGETEKAANARINADGLAE